MTEASLQSAFAIPAADTLPSASSWATEVEPGFDNPPVSVVFGWLGGGVSRQDTIAHARSWAERRLDGPDTARWYVQKAGPGWAWEVQEGGDGAPYLPSVLRALTTPVGAKARIPTGEREIIISSLPHGGIDAVILPEGVSGEGVSVQPDFKASMGWVNPKAWRVLTVGLSTVVAGFLLLGLSAAMLLVSEAPAPRLLPVEENLPVLQWPDILESHPAPEGKPILRRLYFADGAWRVEWGADDAAL